MRRRGTNEMLVLRRGPDDKVKCSANGARMSGADEDAPFRSWPSVAQPYCIWHTAAYSFSHTASQNAMTDEKPRGTNHN